MMSAVDTERDSLFKSTTATFLDECHRAGYNVLTIEADRHGSYVWEAAHTSDKLTHYVTLALTPKSRSAGSSLEGYYVELWIAVSDEHRYTRFLFAHDGNDVPTAFMWMSIVELDVAVSSALWNANHLEVAQLAEADDLDGSRLSEIMRSRNAVRDGSLLRIALERAHRVRRTEYRIVVVRHSPRLVSHRRIDVLGAYDPKSVPPTVTLDEDRVREWLRAGARPSKVVAGLLAQKGIFAPHEPNSSDAAPSSSSR